MGYPKRVISNNTNETVFMFYAPLPMLENFLL